MDSSVTKVTTRSKTGMVKDCLDSLEKLLIASFFTEYWESNKLT